MQKRGRHRDRVSPSAFFLLQLDLCWKFPSTELRTAEGEGGVKELFIFYFILFSSPFILFCGVPYVEREHSVVCKVDTQHILI